MQYATELAGDAQGPFIDFWLVFTQGTRKQFENHPNYMLFAPLFFNTIDMINPRVLVVHNQDVCRLLTQGRGNLMGAGVKDDGGDFIKYWIGRIVVVEGDCLMICRFDCGYMAYCPDLTRLPHELNVLVACKVCLLVATAGAAEHKWDLGVAKAVLKETEDRFRELGLDQLF